LQLIEEFRKRRQKRLDARAVEKYRQRREMRVRARFDDEEENNAPKKSGHGNTRIPYGLCQREGIQVGKDWTPSDAWNALEGKGYKAGEVYKELRSTGKVAKKSFKRPPMRMEEKHFPDFMKTRALKKSTMEIASFVSDHCDDGNITEFLGMSVSNHAKLPPKVKCTRSSKDSGAAVSTTYPKSTRIPLETTVKVPMLSKDLTKEERAQAIRDFCHEWTHYIDFIGREKDQYGHFSETMQELQDAVKSYDGKIGEEATKLFRDYIDGYNQLDNEFKRRLQELPKELMKEKFGDRVPGWIHSRTGYVDIWGVRSSGEYAEAKKHAKELKKRENALKEEFARKKRAFMDGSTNLQGIYDALSGGAHRDAGRVKFGHSKRYFERRETERGLEALADYVALKATNPKLCEVFIKDKPEIARALDHTIVALTKKLKGDV